MKYVYDDGGRKAAGYKGSTGDCVTRAIAIATQRPYEEIYKKLAAGNAEQRRSKRDRKSGRGVRTAREGISTTRKWFKDYMQGLGFRWVPTMQIGSGCQVHLTDRELPMGRLVVAVSKHYCAVIDGVIHDTHDSQRTTFEIGYKDGIEYKRRYERCVYGYWILD